MSNIQRISMPNPVIYIVALLLFIGAAPLPYGYYMLLRLIVCGVFAWASFITYERKHETLPWVYGIVAILFNPLLKIHFPKEIWVLIDIATAILLLYTRKVIQVQPNENT